MICWGFVEFYFLLICFAVTCHHAFIKEMLAEFNFLLFYISIFSITDLHNFFLKMFLFEIMKMLGICST